MHNTPLRREHVLAILGETDNALVAEIVRAGATPDELTAAHAWVANDADDQSRQAPREG